MPDGSIATIEAHDAKTMQEAQLGSFCPKGRRPSYRRANPPSPKDHFPFGRASYITGKRDDADKVV